MQRHLDPAEAARRRIQFERDFKDWEEIFMMDTFENIPDEMDDGPGVNLTECELQRSQHRNPLPSSKLSAFDYSKLERKQ